MKHILHFRLRPKAKIDTEQAEKALDEKRIIDAERRKKEYACGQKTGHTRAPHSFLCSECGAYIGIKLKDT